MLEKSGYVSEYVFQGWGVTMIEFKGSWEDHLHQAKIFYNNSYQASIEMAPFEALYARRCISPLCWDKLGERRHLGQKIIIQTIDKVKVIREHSRQHRACRKLGR